MKPITVNIELLTTELNSALKKSLPGIDAQKKMISTYQRNLIEYFGKDLKLREAAVLIILYKEFDSIKTLLIERMPDPGPHSGQIAFPGGRKENFDNDLIDTAIREAEEEIGVKVKRDEILGSLTPVEIPVSKFSVLPVVSYIDRIPEITKCPREVQNVFSIDLFELFGSRTIRKIDVRGEEIDVPCYTYKDYIIWGATAMVLSEFEEIFNQI